jgi:hypothetical protein
MISSTSNRLEENPARQWLVEHWNPRGGQKPEKMTHVKEDETHK